MKSLILPEVGKKFVPTGEIANTHKQRRKGLSRTELKNAPSSMTFVNCRSIHTFGMKFYLGIVFLDKDNIVLATRIVAPRRIIFSPKHTHTIVEIPIR